MKTINFPYLAVALSLFLLLVITRGSETDSEGITALPLLTLLIINEGAFFLALAGAFIGIRYFKTVNFKIMANPFYALTTLLCILLMIQFTLLGIKLWPI